jgi:hypothetical protein
MAQDGRDSRPSLELLRGNAALNGEHESSSDPVSVDASGTLAAGQSEHALLVAGKIGVEEFMDMTVDRALAHLDGGVSAQRLSTMREILRAQLEQDPYLNELVQRAAVGG